jgi:hypothetical protein
MALNRGEQGEQQIEHSDKPRSFENAIERTVILTSGSVLQVPLAEFRGRTSAPPPTDGTRYGRAAGW